MLPPASRYAAVLAVLRIYTGAFWLMHGLGKITSPDWAVRGGGMSSMLQDMTSHSSGAYHDFVIGVVLPNIGIFGTLVAWGETLTGVSLLLGLLTRLGGAVGAFLALNYLLAKGGFTSPFPYSGLDAAAIALSVINAFLPTGLVAGIDGLIAARKAASRK
jgi:uncharacterized membrane protein YphA (DoxX/SURF4 family)